LIVDDLDRIDPEHIFRLLNVFAAHLDTCSEAPNKLGFDKIIFVCDINNLRNIFRAKYGTYTDFNGYIDKFYSCEVYRFDNRGILQKIAYEAFKNVEIKGVQANNSLEFYNRLFFRIPCLPIELLPIFISYGMISLRTLITRLVHKIEIDPTRNIRFDYRENVSQINNPLLVQFRILKEVTGGYDILKEFVFRIPENGFLLPDINAYCNQMLYFLNYRKTFGTTQGPPVIMVDGMQFVMKLPDDTRESLHEALTYQIDAINQVQHQFSTKQFKSLLTEFLDFLIHVDN
jgi:hypothetical protein